MGIHDGHRERMKRRFVEHGLDSFDDHMVLELFLFYVVPRGDTNPIAHELIDTFGSLSGVMEAPAEELKKIKGVGDSAALFLSLIPQVSRRYMMSLEESVGIIDNVDTAGKYLTPFYLYETVEVVRMVCMDAKHKVLCCSELSRGVADTASVSARKIMEKALSRNATGVILAHNHTSGIAIPSEEDIYTTRIVKDALKLIGVELVDHLIIAGKDFVSLSDSGLL